MILKVNICTTGSDTGALQQLRLSLTETNLTNTGFIIDAST
jgi:hypothetical protein